MTPEIVFFGDLVFWCFGWGVGGVFGAGGEFGLFRCFFRGLVFGAEPADFALGFFGGALVVEVDEALEELFFGFLLVFGLFGPGGGGAGAADEFFGEVVPAVGFEDGAVEVVVEFAQNCGRGCPNLCPVGVRVILARDSLARGRAASPWMRLLAAAYISF